MVKEDVNALWARTSGVSWGGAWTKWGLDIKLLLCVVHIVMTITIR